MSTSKRSAAELESVRCFDLMRARLLRVVRGYGADYYDRSFYGTVHEASHGLLLHLTDWSCDAINAALVVLPERGRMREEVLAHRMSRIVCRRFHYPLFEDSLRHAAESTRAFALSKGEEITWTVEEFIRADRLDAFDDGLARADAKLMDLFWNWTPRRPERS